MNGKGSARRPSQLSADELAERWAATFGKSTHHTGAQDVGSPRERESGASDSMRLPDGPGSAGAT